MKCLECKNKIYCHIRKTEPELQGCTSGVPEYLPVKVADELISKIIKASNELGIDKAEYLAAVSSEFYKKWEKMRRPY